MEHVLFIIPPADKLFHPLTYPPLGILYLASIVRNYGYTTEVCDLREEYNLNKIPDSDVYCVTATTVEAPEAREIGNYLKGKGFSIIGGAHASNLPEYFLSSYDCVLVGEGEKAIIPIIDERISGKVHGEMVEDIDNVPLPARDLMSKEKVVNTKLWGGYGFYEDDSPLCGTLITSRSCPFNCAFCANIPKQVRYHSAEYVANEIKHMNNKYNIRHFDILDDHFTMNKERLKELRPVFKELNVEFRCQARGDALDDEVCSMLADMGCDEVDIGVEHADDGVLELMNKGITVDQFKDAISRVKEYGIHAKIFLMAGLPGETCETIDKTKMFIIDTQPDKAPVTMFMPFPKCDVWKNPSKYGTRILTKDFNKYFFRYPCESVIETDWASKDELTEHFNELRNFVLSGVWRDKYGI